MQFVTLSTPRLFLRPTAASDAPTFAEAIAENFGDPFFWFDETGLEPARLDKYLSEKRDDFLKGDDLAFLIFSRDDGQLLGGAGLHPSNDTEGWFGISYWIRQGMAGRGFASEAANSLLRFAFTRLRARSVGIGYMRGNEGSRRIINKLGFVRYAQEIKPDGSTAEIFRRTDLRGLQELAVDYGTEDVA